MNRITVERSTVNRTFILFLALVLCVSPVAFAEADELHRIDGFRSASFGMTTDEVRAAIDHDFGLTGAAVNAVDNPEEATRLLIISVPELSPGPGAAHVYYIFGATTGRLMHVNVVWATSETPTDAERNHIAVAGVQLASYFSDLNWKPDGSVMGVSDRPNEVLLFAGVDPADAGVEVVVSGVPMTDGDGRTVAPEGPAILRISYAARYGDPDVVRVDPGGF